MTELNSNSYIRTNSYFVKLEQFEGPLDVLLELISKEKLDICEISLAQITDQYLEYLKGLPQTEPALIADFLVIAAHLILIKSKSLLPQLEISQEEEMGIQELQLRLKILQVIKEGTVVIKKTEQARQSAYGRDLSAGFVNIFYPPPGIKNRNLLKYIKEIIKESPTVAKLKQETIKIVVSFEATLAKLKKRFERILQTTFNQVVGGTKSKMDVIVTFLALLELIKQKVVIVEQSEQFSDINIQKPKP